MNILERIKSVKARTIAEKKAMVPVKKLESSLFFESPCVSLTRYLKRTDKVGIIAEFKKKSPSRGDIQKYADPAKICLGYMQSGASALSVLTDLPFFDGRNEDLSTAREWNYCPILRKDFIIDAYQIIEAKSIGADAVLLIKNLVPDGEIERFAKLARNLGMEVLIEIHDPSDFDSIYDMADLIGINSRSLSTMKVLDRHHLSALDTISSDKPLVAESGISDPEYAAELLSGSYDGLLIGSHFMSQPDPVHACRRFVTNTEQALALKSRKIKRA